MPTTHRLQTGRKVRLAELSSSGKDFHSDRKQAEEEFKSLRHELIEFQQQLYAESKQSLLVVLQAMDAGGKDGTIRNVFRGVNPQGTVVKSFKKPTDEELGHDFLWRIHNAAPLKGMIGVFNRSHYEDVLVVRVDQIVPESVWRPRYDRINQFERLLSDNGTRIIKIYLHISPDEQKERFQERLDDPAKHWKFDRADLDKRRQWDDYMAAYQEMLEHCTTDIAPWHVIPSDQKWYRNLAIARILIDGLQQMNPSYPDAESDLEGFVVE